MHATYQEYIASLGPLDEPDQVVCLTKGCGGEPESGADHCTACLDAIHIEEARDAATNLKVAA